MSTNKLAGKIALITGGSSGIGLATAKQFVSEGAYIFITGLRQPELDAAVKLIERNVTGIRSDVSSLADLDRVYAAIKSEKVSTFSLSTPEVVPAVVLARRRSSSIGTL
jgi:NAD(P)-dependent dehydrogenase (short-subunit alcohol dehydrogenase family)